jgi:hypothetical protein
MYKSFFEGKCELIYLKTFLNFKQFSLAQQIDSWSFMATPLPMMSLVAIYLCFIYEIGPKFMKHRAPYSLTWIIRLYNVFQVIACAVFVVKIQAEGFTFKKTWKCIPETDISEDSLSIFATNWWFLMLRCFEFIETVFFVLKKKQNQISILHVYHHISTAVLLWLFLKYSGGKSDVIFIQANRSNSLAFRYDGDFHSRNQCLRSHSNVWILLFIKP